MCACIIHASCMHSIARSPAAACVAVGVPCHLHLLYLCYSSVLHVCNIVSIPLFLSNIARVQGVGCGVSPNLDVSQEDALADLHARNVELERLGYLLAAAHHLHLGGPQKNRTSHRKTKTASAQGNRGQTVRVWSRCGCECAGGDGSEEGLFSLCVLAQWESDIWTIIR